MAPYALPSSPALNEKDIPMVNVRPVAGLDNLSLYNDKEASLHQSLVDEYRAKSSGGRTSRSLPVAVSFPTFGQSVYLVAELTQENHAPAIDLSYQKEKKEGKK